MYRVRVNPYGPSNSAKELANYLGVKRLLTNGTSRFRARANDVVINWGIGKGNVGNARQINKLESVQLASNKLHTFKVLKEHQVKIPKWTPFTNKLSEYDDNKVWLARTTLSGHSGQGIVVGTPSELPSAPLYVEYIPKVAEYRAIVVGDEVVDFKQKLKKSSPRNEDGEVIEEERINHDPHVWNLDGGYIMARNNITKPEGIDELSIKATKALGLDFGAIDIIADEQGTLYVLEVNTAFGLEGTTIELVGNAIKGLL